MGDGMGVSQTGIAYAKHIVETMNLFDTHDPDQVFVFGPAYKGISLSGAIASKLFELYKINVRCGYNRKEVKPHGADAKKWLVGDLRDNDIVLIGDDVLTTADTKVESWNNISVRKKNLTHGGIVVAFNRQETDLQGRSPVKVLEEDGKSVSAILEARTVFDYLHNRDVEGTVLVDDTAYEAFQQHQKEFGIKD